MTKIEFIGFLKSKEIELQHVSHWKQSFEGTDEHWTLYRPSVDWLEDRMDLSKEGIVKIIYSEAFYDDPKYLEMSYEEFIEDYSKSVGYV